MMQTDYTPTGVKIEGAYENDRNAENSALYKAIIRECFGVSDVIIAHHLVYVIKDQREVDGKIFNYEIIEEVPSADTLIFDHEIAQHIWGPNFKEMLTRLACEPVKTRDKLLAELYYARGK
jgi:hypothetical protein